MKDKKVTTTKAGSGLNDGYHEGDWITRSEGLEGPSLIAALNPKLIGERDEALRERDEAIDNADRLIEMLDEAIRERDEARKLAEKWRDYGDACVTAVFTTSPLPWETDE